MVYCPLLTTPYNGTKSSEDTKCGVTVGFSCNEGFMLSGKSSLACMTNGRWDGVTPQCEGMLLNLYVDECVGFVFCLNCPINV